MKFRVFPIGCGRFLKFLKNFYTCCDNRMIGNPLTLFSHPRRIGSNTKSSWLEKIPHVCMFWLSTWNQDSGSQPDFWANLLKGSLLIQKLPQKFSPTAIQLVKWQAVAVDPVHRYLQIANCNMLNKISFLIFSAFQGPESHFWYWSLGCNWCIKFLYFFVIWNDR